MLNPASQAIAPSTMSTNRMRSDPKRGDQLDQRAQRGQAVFADGERHGAESADGRKTHQDVDHAEHDLGQRFRAAPTIGLRALPAADKRKAEQNAKRTPPAGCRLWQTHRSPWSGMMCIRNSVTLCALAWPA